MHPADGEGTSPTELGVDQRLDFLRDGAFDVAIGLATRGIVHASQRHHDHCAARRRINLSFSPQP